MQKIVSAVTLIKWTLWNWPHTRTDCSQVVKIATLSEGFRQDVREVTRTDCSLVGKMALLSEEFRQDVREVTRTDCSLMAKMALLSEEFRQDVREVTRTNCKSAHQHFCRKGSDRMSGDLEEHAAV